MFKGRDVAYQADWFKFKGNGNMANKNSILLYQETRKEDVTI